MPLAYLHRIPAAIILILLFFGPLAAEENFPFIGIVKEDGINIRSDSTVSSKVIGSARKGQEVTVIAGAYDWYKIRFPLDTPSGHSDKNSFAWMHKKFIERKPQSAVEAAPAEEAAVEVGQPVAAVEIEGPQAAVSAGEVSITGIVKPYGRVFGRRATHKLIAEDKQVFLLKGNKKELNALNSRRVRVSGIKEEGAPKGKYPLIEVRAIEEIN
ncbi:MAG: SH3 domain-containing protein [Candidatus Omnitrophica bacterium]|nr:SH3 domain-containing protein [Candidatus Omnitrophota bacterium]MBL7151710.1 SH3 domain-containing protein [Candidatus Omnitrophota bacterium]